MEVDQFGTWCLARERACILTWEAFDSIKPDAPMSEFTLFFVVSSEENTPLDLDDHGGRTFLRVLLHLTMHDYPPLVSGALQLLFRHFSQRQEVLQAFKQVRVDSVVPCSACMYGKLQASLLCD